MEANFPRLRVRVIRVSNKILEMVIKERGERRNSVREKCERVYLVTGKVFKGVGKGVSVMGAMNTVMDVDKNLGDGGEPELMAGGQLVKRSVSRSEEAMGKNFGNMLKGCVGNGALRSIGKV